MCRNMLVISSKFTNICGNYSIFNSAYGSLQHLFDSLLLGYTVKKRLAIIPSPAGMSITKLSLARNNKIFSRTGRVWLVTSRLGTGKSLHFFTV